MENLRLCEGRDKYYWVLFFNVFVNLELFYNIEVFGNYNSNWIFIYIFFC